MKHIKLFEAFINESSTLSTIGATPAQVSAIHKSKFNESKGRLTFKDLEIGDEFLIFGENGQLWVKTSVRQAKFVKNVGKKTAPYYKKYGSLNVFSPTMDVTLPNDTYQ